MLRRNLKNSLVILLNSLPLLYKLMFVDVNTVHQPDVAASTHTSHRQCYKWCFAHYLQTPKFVISGPYFDFLGILPAKLRRRGAIFSPSQLQFFRTLITFCMGRLNGSQNAHRKRLKSRRSFEPVSRKLLNSLFAMCVCVVQWTNTKYNMENLKSP